MPTLLFLLFILLVFIVIIITLILVRLQNREHFILNDPGLKNAIMKDAMCKNKKDLNRLLNSEDPKYNNFIIYDAKQKKYKINDKKC